MTTSPAEPTPEQTPTTVHFWFDAGCPFTWATSRWLRDAAARHGTQVEWRLMSLPILNEGRPVPEQYREAMARSSRTARVLAAAGEAGGSPAVGSLYRALGELVHERGRPADDAVLSEALVAADLSGGLVDAADDPAYDAIVRASHEESQRRVGMDSGSPITALDGGPAYFGPVVAPVPGDAAATHLWEALVAISKVPELSELKRGRATL